MASRLNPYLNFNGDARQAMEFYAEVFGGDLQLSTFAAYGGTGADADRIMHALLATTAGFTIMASDLTSDMGFEPMAGSAVSVGGDDADELRGYWDQLSAGGAVQMPLEKQVWGDEFGMCTDKFGIPWMVNITQPPA